MERGREVAAALLIAFGLFGLLSVYSAWTGQAGVVLSKWLSAWLGFAAGLPGAFVVWIGTLLWRRPLAGRDARRFAGVGAAAVVAVVGLHIVGRASAWPAVWSPREEMLVSNTYGGYIGGLLAGAFMKFFGPLGTFLLLAVLSMIGWILLVDRPKGAPLPWLRRTSVMGGAAAEVAAADQSVPDGGRPAGLFARWRARRQAKDPSAPSRSRAGKGGRRRRAKAAAADPSMTPRDRTIAGFALEAEAVDGEDDVRTVPGTNTPGGDGHGGQTSGSGTDPGPAPRPRAGAYAKPALRLLEQPRVPRRGRTGDGEEDRSQLLEATLSSFGIDGRVVSVSRGPTVTRYEVQPPAGVKVSRIVGLADDISLALAAAGVRIEAPVPGKSVVGIEVPNKDTRPVVLREILASDEFQHSRSPLTIGLGRDIAGQPLVADLQKLLHLLIAGATGSGKSVCLNSIITSLLYKADPDQVKLMMIDPKRVELSVYDGIPHLLTPVVTDPKEAAAALRWVVKEMERRYHLLSKTGVRNLDAYNRRRRKPEGLDEYVPYLVVIIDELADLMLVASADVENSIVRLAQMARAAGIYLIIATQRPSVDVITGLIKANVPSRLAFAVSSQVDSRTILDMGGAERLLGRGDMLFYPIGAPKPVRAQGAWVSDAEVEAVADAWRDQAAPVYVENIVETPPLDEEDGQEAEDELFEQAVALVREQGHASVSMLQRRFRIGYARAARLIDVMEVQGIVGPYQGSKPREVIGVDGAL